MSSPLGPINKLLFDGCRSVWYSHFRRKSIRHSIFAISKRRDQFEQVMNEEPLTLVLRSFAYTIQ